MSQNSETETICFQRSPCGVLILDKAGSILKLNEALAAMLALPADQFLGKTRETLQPVVCQGLFKGDGLIHFAGPEMQQEKWLLCTEFEGSTHTTKFYQDVTGQVKLQQRVDALQQQVEDLTITDALTGLANPRAFNNALNSQVTRSRRYNNPLCLAIMELVDETDPGASLSDDAILATSRHLRDRLRWVDTIARWDHNHFVTILPETNAEHGSELIGQISAGFSDIVMPSLQQDQTLKLKFGLAQWMKGNDAQMLMERAAQSLNSQSEELLETAAT